MKADWGVEV